MERGYWFTSDLFTIHKGEDSDTNPHCFGKELSEWLRAKFSALGYEVEEVIPEDWGWCVMCKRDDYLLWVGCASMCEQAEEYETENLPLGKDVTWHVFPVVEVPFFYFKSFIRQFLGQLDTTKPLDKIDKELEHILVTEPRIKLCEEP
ncbi:hypothetical protein [Pseudoalteromonas sp. GB56]